MSATAARRPSWRGTIAGMSGSRVTVGAMALLAVFALVVLYRKGVDTSFFYDDWDFVLRRSSDTVGTFLEPHNGHLSLVPVAIYKLLFATVGLDDYDPYRLVQVVLHVTVGLLVFAFVRPRLGGVPALGAAALVLFLGTGFQDILWPFQIGFLSALAFGLAGFLCLERSTRGGDIAAMVLFGLSLASASIGIPIVIGAVVYLAIRPTPWRRAWVVAVPIVVYGIWYLRYGASELKSENVTAITSFTAEEIAGAVGGVVGLSVDWGRALAVAGGAALVWHLSRVSTFRRALVAVLVIAFSFWILTALARAEMHDPAASRYVYPGGVFVLLIAAEALRGWRPLRRPLLMLAVGVLLAVISGFQAIDQGADGLRETDQLVQADLTAVEIGAGHMPPELQIDPDRAPQVTVGPYLETVRRIGSSPAYSETELASFEEARRQRADAAFQLGYGMKLEPGSATPAGPAPVAEGSSRSLVRTRGSCLVGRPQPGGAALRDLSFSVPRGGVSLRAPGATVRVRRFAPAFTEPGKLQGDATRAVVRIPPDRSSRPWHMAVSGARSLTICGIGAGP